MQIIVILIFMIFIETWIIPNQNLNKRLSKLTDLYYLCHRGNISNAKSPNKLVFYHHLLEFTSETTHTTDIPLLRIGWHDLRNTWWHFRTSTDASKACKQKRFQSCDNDPVIHRKHRGRVSRWGVKSAVGPEILLDVAFILVWFGIGFNGCEFFCW